MSKKTKNEEQISSYNKKLNWIIILVIIQSLMILVVLFDGGKENATTFDQISSIEEKVSNIDNFFSTNVPGYEDSVADSTLENDETSIKEININIENEPFLGDENAPVTIVEFSDYQCPFCRKYYTESFDKLKTEYIDTGKVKYVFKDFPLNFHDAAKPAALAANCAYEQLGNEGYFEFHDLIFDKQNALGVNTIDFDNEDLKKWAKEVKNLNYDNWLGCFEDNSNLNEIEEDLAEGVSLGISGTPTFFINDKMLVGAQPYSVIKAEIDKNLNS